MANEFDLVFKDAMGRFMEGMKKTLNINEEFLEPAPTELINLRGTNHYLDFVYLTKEGTLIDLEFQSTPPTSDDYARFISYKVSLFRQRGMIVKIYIICIPQIKIKLPIEFDEELSFTPKIISFKDFDSKKIINTTRNKLNDNETLSQEDLMNLIFAPLMVEKKYIENQLIETVEIFSRINYKNIDISPNEFKESGDMLGLLVVKLIKDENLQEKLLGAIIMRTAGLEKLMEKYKAEGIEEGINILKVAKKLLSENYTMDEVMEKTGLNKEDLEIIK